MTDKRLKTPSPFESPSLVRTLLGGGGGRGGGGTPCLAKLDDEVSVNWGSRFWGHS